MHGRHLINFWCKLQGGVALSSGEAELTSLTKGACELTGVLNLVNENLGTGIVGKCRCDSSAARGTAQRTGVGQLKHVSIKQLWIQERVMNKNLIVSWMPRKLNPADMLTHSLTGAAFSKVLNDLPITFKGA